MPNDRHMERIKCPFFLRFERGRKDIICEGLLPGTEIIHAFRFGTDRENWIVQVCQTHQCCEKCTLAKVLTEKYESDPQGLPPCGRL